MDEMRQKRGHLEPRDVCAKNGDDLRLNKTYNTVRTFTCSSRQVSSFMCFVLILVFTLSLVSDVSPFGFTTHTQFQVFFLMLYSDFVLSSSSWTVIILSYCTSRKRVLLGVVLTHPVGYNRPTSAVNDLSVTK